VAPRILILRRRYIGDVVLLGSLVRNLRLHWPESKISVLTNAGFGDVLDLHPDVDGRLEIPKRKHPLYPFRFGALLARLRRARFDYAFDIDNSEGTALLTRLTGAAQRVTLAVGGREPKLRRAYTAVARVTREERDSRHITEHYLRVLEPVGVPVRSREVRLVPRAEDLKAVDRLMEQLGLASDLPCLLVHPGHSNPFRFWPAERFARLCDALLGDRTCRILLTAGPGQGELLGEVVSRMQKEAVVLREPLPLPRFAALIQRMDLLVGHDSAPAHIASAVGTPVVALLGSRDFRRWRPLGEDNVSLNPPFPCTECVAPGVCVPEDGARSYCVQRITEDEVLSAVRGRIERL
jgi:ADP-heptose:LPS heptosyltransferase